MGSRTKKSSYMPFFFKPNLKIKVINRDRNRRNVFLHPNWIPQVSFLVHILQQLHVSSLCWRHSQYIYASERPLWLPGVSLRCFNFRNASVHSTFVEGMGRMWGRLLFSLCRMHVFILQIYGLETPQFSTSHTNDFSILPTATLFGALLPNFSYQHVL